MVGTMMARDPGDRFSSCAELLPAIEQCLERVRSSGSPSESDGSGEEHASDRPVRRSGRSRKEGLHIAAYLESNEGKITLTLSAFLVVCTAAWAFLWEPASIRLDQDSSAGGQRSSVNSGVARVENGQDPTERPVKSTEEGREKNAEKSTERNTEKNTAKNSDRASSEGESGPPVLSNAEEVALFKEVRTIINRWKGGVDAQTTLAQLEDFKRKHPGTTLADKEIKNIREGLKELGSSAVSKYRTGKCAELLKRGDYYGAVNGYVELAKTNPENLSEINDEIKKVEDAALEVLKKAEAQ